MSCTYTLPAGFETTHPEITCLMERPRPTISPRLGLESMAPQAWYDRYIGQMLDCLPDETPSMCHRQLAVYWLARTALRRLVTSLYEGEITLDAFVWCRDRIRSWEAEHTKDSEIVSEDDPDETTHTQARAWAVGLVRQAERFSKV